MKVWQGLLRRLLRIPAPKITHEQAVKIALAELDRRGSRLMPSHNYASRGPVVQEKLRVWAVWLDPGFRPCRVVVIDNQTGEVMAFHALPR